MRMPTAATSASREVGEIVTARARVTQRPLLQQPRLGPLPARGQARPARRGSRDRLVRKDLLIQQPQASRLKAWREHRAGDSKGSKILSWSWSFDAWFSRR